ncbi:hypothetical protein HED22_06505 [Thalassospira sp. HF15]|uniref:hypothetical protein n=1 Tax=Thalassospira sp. HF15 TaxID=2722755 RepID=UPI00143003EE|nr:hypothetical protein [Thalassospira sp. HF15]NIY75291.1 hypothetical protein [Thalassospira sp. HF15]
MHTTEGTVGEMMNNWMVTGGAVSAPDSVNGDVLRDSDAELQASAASASTPAACY